MKTHLTFYVGLSPPDGSKFPCFYLAKAKWDDFGFSTSFTLYFMRDKDSKDLIGGVKIAFVGQSGGRTSLPVDFPSLEPGHFSLGQSDQYYERLGLLGAPIKKHVLEALHDVTSSHEIMKSVEGEKAYSFSLTRFLGPLALANLKKHKRDTLRLEFDSYVHSSDSPTKCVFEFRKEKHIPGRINALIGTNGAGKTQLLANFVSGILGMGEKKIEVSERGEIKKVIVVSYSVFDRFFLPGQIEIPANRTRREYISENLKYVYIGLRERVGADSRDKKSSPSSKDLTKIAGPVAFARRYTNALHKLKEDGRYDQWKETMGPILREADFLHADDLPDATNRTRFRWLGAGHKATISMLTSLFSELEGKSLVVIDEPENHLHPTLLSAMLHVLREMLESTDSVAVVSTHSPIVIQEIPSKYVQVVTKINDQATLVPLRRESLGTSIDTLISEIFGLSYQLPSYVTLLKDLARRQIDLDDIEHELGERLSAEARSFYLSMLGK